MGLHDLYHPTNDAPQEPCLVYDLDIVIAPMRPGRLLENYLNISSHVKAFEDWQVVGFIDFFCDIFNEPNGHLLSCSQGCADFAYH